MLHLITIDEQYLLITGCNEVPLHDGSDYVAVDRICFNTRKSFVDNNDDNIITSTNI